MNKRGDIPEKTGYYILFIIVFGISVAFAAIFLSEGITEFNTGEIKDSIVATKVLSCFSGGELGVIDETEITRSSLVRCFPGAKYFLKINLDKRGGENLFLENTPGDLHDFRSVKRYVKLNDGEGILEIDYVKNLRRYED